MTDYQKEVQRRLLSLEQKRQTEVQSHYQKEVQSRLLSLEQKVSELTKLIKNRPLPSKSEEKDQ